MISQSCGPVIFNLKNHFDLEGKVRKNNIIFFLFVFCFFHILNAGTTGKIAGNVVDKASGKPLAGVNIEIVSAGIGAASGEDGYYFINNIPPGLYILQAAYLGYNTVRIENVKVSVDQTTEIKIELSEQVMDLNETITVVARRPLVRKDVTSKRAIIEGNLLTDVLPVSSINDVLALQAGIVTDENGSIHIRGGRTGEVAYLVDGTYVKDPFDNGLGGNVDVEAIQEMEVISGTFNAEYGNALSGIINIVTKEGSPVFKYKFQYESPMLNESPYHQADWLLKTDLVKGLSAEDKEKYKDLVRKEDGSSAYKFIHITDSKFSPDKTLLNVLGKFNGSISGPVPFLKNAFFFSSGTFRNEDSYLPYGFNLDRILSTKLSYRPLSSLKIQLNYDWSNRWYQLYDHQYKYWTYMEKIGEGSYPIWADFKNRWTLKLTHTLNNSTFYTMSLSRVYNYARRSIEERHVVSDPHTGALISSDYLTRGYYQGAEGNFRNGDDRYWYRTRSTTYVFDGNVTSQLNRFNLLKSGFEYRKHDIFRHRIGMPPRSRIEFFDEKPFEFSAYVQDKIELDYLIMNIGLRFDYFNAESYYYPDPGQILVTETDASGQSVLTTVARKKTPGKYKLSPRIGFAHPITESTVFHFAYGHFFQTPRYYDLYRNSALDNLLANDALVGNPGLEPEETVSFEAGFKQQIGNDYSVEITAYYKDISNLISSFYYFSGRDYTIFVNADYGRVKGIDLTLNKRYSNYFGGSLNYTFMIAKGNESDPTEGYSQYREEKAHLKPNRNFYLDFDRRHSFNLNLGINLPKKFGPPVFNFYPLQHFAANFLFTAASGLPYTPSSRDPEATVLPEKNSARKPWTRQLDLRLSKKFYIWKMSLDMYLRMENVFDNINVLRVWSRTGEAWDQGPTSNYSKDRQANPENVDIRRTIRVGMIVRF